MLVRGADGQFFIFPVFQPLPRLDLPKSCRRPIAPPSPRAAVGTLGVGSNYSTLCPSLPRSGPFPPRLAAALDLHPLPDVTTEVQVQWNFGRPKGTTR